MNELEWNWIYWVSGGKDSTAMILVALDEGLKMDHVLFFDNGVLRDEAYQVIEKLAPMIPCGITKIKPEKSYEYMLTEKPVKKKLGEIVKGYGWPRRGLGWCCTWEQRILRRYERTMLPLIECQGVVLDDSAPKPDKESCKWRRVKYPLFERGFNSKGALSYCKARGFKWSGYYDRGNAHLSCWLCPYNHISEMRNLWKNENEKWEKLRTLDLKTHGNYLKRKTVWDLQDKFEREETGDLKNEEDKFTVEKI